MASIPSKRPAPSNKQDAIAEAMRRAAEARARIEAMRNGSSTPAAASPALPKGASPSPAPPAAAPVTGMSKLDALKARMAAASQQAAKLTASAHAPASEPPKRPPAEEAQPWNGPTLDQRAEMDRRPEGRGTGINLSLHPLLRSDAVEQTKKEQNQRRRQQKSVEKEEIANPYITEGLQGSGRRKRELNFTHNMNQRPAMEAAKEIRRKAALEVMKARIQAHATKAGLEDSADTTCFEVPEPPDVEWWDEPLQSGIDNNDQITNLIVHPVLIDPAQEKFTKHKQPTMFLTKREQKKMRRIRRMEEHKEEQTKIRLGLEPAPAPKVTHRNVMRVFGELAVQGPSAVEDMVNKQVAERKMVHEQANAERQLTKEQKAEKYKEKAKENAAMGLSLHVYKIALGRDTLLDKHRFLINKNAQQWEDMTGVALVTPSFTLVLVEGGQKATGQYQKLMTRRIKWQAILEGKGEVQDKAQWEGVEDKTCVLVHQGQIRERKFKKWGSVRDVETEQQARSALNRAGLENFWVMAKSLEKAV